MGKTGRRGTVAHWIADGNRCDTEAFRGGKDPVQLLPVGCVGQLLAAAQVHLPVGKRREGTLGQQGAQGRHVPAALDFFIAHGEEATLVALRQHPPEVQCAFQGGLLGRCQGQRPARKNVRRIRLHLDDGAAQGFEDGGALAG